MSKPPKAAKPTRSFFDPWNSSATGHQRAENRLGGSTSWRDSRNAKLREQFASGSGGGKRVSDSVGAGSLDFGQDGRTENGGWEKGAKGLRAGGQKSLWETMSGVVVEKPVERPKKRVKTIEDPSTKVVNPFTPFKKSDGTIRETSKPSYETSPSHLLQPLNTPSTASTDPSQTKSTPASPPPLENPAPPQIFTNLTIYINGSTAPQVSDHKLKHLLTTHGARTSISLGRRTVTHVILSKPSHTGGTGGGLAGSKIQKEITRVGGKGIRFVSVEWVLDSVKAGKRLSEGRYEAVRLAPRGVGSVMGMFGKKE